MGSLFSRSALPKIHTQKNTILYYLNATVFFCFRGRKEREKKLCVPFNFFFLVSNTRPLSHNYEIIRQFVCVFLLTVSAGGLFLKKKEATSWQTSLAILLFFKRFVTGIKDGGAAQSGKSTGLAKISFRKPLSNVSELSNWQDVLHHEQLSVIYLFKLYLTLGLDCVTKWNGLPINLLSAIIPVATRQLCNESVHRHRQLQLQRTKDPPDHWKLMRGSNYDLPLFYYIFRRYDRVQFSFWKIAMFNWLLSS